MEQCTAPKPRKNQDVAGRFWSKVQRGAPEDCWLFGKSPHTNYGRFWLNDAQRCLPAHRVSWMITHGSIPDSLNVLHMCEGRYAYGDFTSRSCVNPAHLKLGTYQENADDKKAAGHSQEGDRSGARRHHERLSRGNAHYSRITPEVLARGERHGQAKLLETAVLQIRESYARDGKSAPYLAAKYNMSIPTIKQIVRGKTWTHLPCSPRIARWSMCHDACSRCGTTDQHHQGHGLCTSCYLHMYYRAASGKY